MLLISEKKKVRNLILKREYIQPIFIDKKNLIRPLDMRITNSIHISKKLKLKV